MPNITISAPDGVAEYIVDQGKAIILSNDSSATPTNREAAAEYLRTLIRPGYRRHKASLANEAIDTSVRIAAEEARVIALNAEDAARTSANETSFTESEADLGSIE